MAFVEFSSKEDLHKALQLHHTQLSGRRINVEKTVGGRNQELRSLKIRQIRSEQKIAVSEAIDKVLVEFERANVLPSLRSLGDKLLNRLYAMTSSTVREVWYEMNENGCEPSLPLCCCVFFFFFFRVQ